MSVEGKPERRSAETNPQVRIRYREIESSLGREFEIIITDSENTNFLGRFSVKRERDARSIVGTISYFLAADPMTASDVYLAATKMAGDSLIADSEFIRTGPPEKRTTRKVTEKIAPVAQSSATPKRKLPELKDEIVFSASAAAKPIPKSSRSLFTTESREKRETEIYLSALEALTPVRILHMKYDMFKYQMPANEVVSFLNEILQEISDEGSARGNLAFAPENDKAALILEALPHLRNLVNLHALDWIPMDGLFSHIDQLVQAREPRTGFFRDIFKKFQNRFRRPKRG